MKNIYLVHYKGGDIMMDYAELYRSMQISVEVMEKVLSPLSAYDCRCSW